MADIVLSSSVRQNLLSLQATAGLLAQTQNRLATGQKVNSALDNPTNFFTAQSLDARASDINNLLDGIGNGVQVLQAANTGISSLQKLVDSAKSVANQALQTTVGYSTKSSVTTGAIAGATASNLLGTGSNPTDATFTGTAATATTTTFTNTAATIGAQLNDSSTSSNATAGSQLWNISGVVSGDAFSVNGKTVTIAGVGPASTDGFGNVTIGGDQTLANLVSAIDGITGNVSNPSSATGGQIQLNTGTANNLTLADVNGGLAIFGLTAGTTTRGIGGTSTTALTGATALSGAFGGSGALSTAFANNDTITVDGQTLTFKTSGASGANQINITDNVTTLLAKIDGLSGGSGSSVSGGKITLHTGTTSDLTISSSNAAALTALGLSGGVSQARGTTSPISGTTLTIGATGGGTATSITFGTGNGQVSTLNQLNTALAANNLQATIDTTGAITVTTTNDAASATIGTLGGSATNTGNAFHGLTAAAPVADATAQATRANLVSQYNNIIAQITTTAQDSSFNGVNLLGGDTLKLVFNETGKSTLNITGVNFNPAGLGLGSLTAGTDFIDNNATNKALTALNSASSTLRSEASSLGSNLSIVQIRQDFSKNLINVLQTGSSNLTLADTNVEAANSQALSTRQSIAVSALSLANQSQQSVLQLLR